MKVSKYILFNVVALLFSGCGGSGSSTITPDPTPLPKVIVSITTQAIKEEIATGDQIDIIGTWSAEAWNNPVYLQIIDESGTFQKSVTFVKPNENQFKFTLDLSETATPGKRFGKLTVKACKDANCSTDFANSTATLEYNFDLILAPDWETVQGNPSHTGYVPIRLRPEQFSKSWEWARPASSDPNGGINFIATGNKKIYVSHDVYFDEGVLYSFQEKTGVEAWRYSFGRIGGLNPPAVKNNKVYIAVDGASGSGSYLWMFNAETGSYISKSSIYSQLSGFFAPTVFGNDVFTNSSGGLTAFSDDGGKAKWVKIFGGNTETSPAVDAKSVYFYSDGRLEIWDRLTGNGSSAIVDPNAVNQISIVSYHATPIIGSRNNVIAFSGGAFSGRGGSNTEQFNQRVLTSFNLQTRSTEWVTQSAYLTAPAVANGILYAGRNNPMVLDAIDENTGKVLWSWTPTGQGDTEFHRNIIAVKNMIFVSTDKSVYALDLFSKTPVWRYPAPGALAISKDRTLLINVGARFSGGQLIAINLRQ